MKKIISIFAILFTFAAGSAFAALSSTFTLPAGTSVTMGDSSATMPFLVANTGTVNLKSVSFVVNTAVYNIDAATTTAPSGGWEIKTFTANSICFTNENGGIAAGSSLVFNIVLTGPLGGAIANAGSDQTDSLAVGSGASDLVLDNCTGIVAPTTSDSWTRKSLAIDLSATPSSAGTGGTITLTMQVTNRSSAPQNTITATPAPPAAYLYGLTNLSGYHSSTTTTITVVSTTDFPNSGTVMIDNEEINYTGKTATTFTGCTRGVNGTTASFHADGVSVYNRTSFTVTNTGGPTPASLSLASGESSTMAWTYTAASTGAIYFSASAGNGFATSNKENSNQVVIGNFNANVSVDSLSVVSGQTVTVTMVVSNNGTSALGNITPTLTIGGTAIKTLVSGPTPTSIASLGAGQSGTFTWTYTISGTLGQTYFFSGYACTASCSSQTNTSTSATGSITTYSVTVNPDTVATGSTNVQIGWTVWNGGGQPIKQTIITFPSGWAYSSATTSAPADWIITPGASTVQFKAGTPIPVGGSKTFYITFSTIPSVTSDTPYTFPVFIKDKKKNMNTNTTVTVTAYVIALTYTPASPISADGTSKYTLTANLTKGGSPVSGVAVAFTTTAGTLSASTGTTDASGNATVDLASPCSQTNINATINATYLNAKDPKTLSPAFSGIVGGTLVYVGGSLTPMSVTTPYNSGFQLQLKNCGTGALTIQTINSTLADTVGNSFNLSSGITINAGSTGTLNFNTNPVTSSSSKCYPTLTINAGAYAGPFSSPGNQISDALTVNSGTDCTTTIQILDWREMY